MPSTTTTKASASSKATQFRRLHESGCFVVPNPWDRGTARLLASLDYRALATTSAGQAFALGRPDTPTSMPRELVLEHIREIVDATELPVNADFQSGYGDSPEAVAKSVALCMGAGVAGLSVEDATGQPDAPLYRRDMAVARVRAARAAIDASGVPAVLTARAECFLVAHPSPLTEAIERLQAYAEAGADCLYAPGMRTPEEITALVEAVAPWPVNVLTVDPSWMTVAALRDLGVRRVSVGSGMARVAWGAFIKVAREIADGGSFAGLAKGEPFAALNKFFSD